MRLLPWRSIGNLFSMGRLLLIGRVTGGEWRRCGTAIDARCLGLVLCRATTVVIHTPDLRCRRR
ncbi:hypothetical protein BV25DRAFT_948721 [Artomyces pyxidatus]|uniref:Uncharacterized protein n=1 Tax=Artomyces pyxidatus TaxID=48021 RepID=A0ACB8SVZ6_9AGAM|nr:hypothetical protein BV25DRAFT_948721 [Artomyces pyxidatus]